MGSSWGLVVYTQRCSQGKPPSLDFHGREFV
jgi:hypothetical protein